LGIVQQTPPTIEWTQAHPKGAVTVSDDVYLVTFRDGDHDHPKEWQLFAPLAAVPYSLLAELKSRLV
jgi:hypothetical protein